MLWAKKSKDDACGMEKEGDYIRTAIENDVAFIRITRVN